MKVTLMQHTSLEVCAHAIKTSCQSYDKSDNAEEKDKDLIDRVGNKFKQKSILEHLTYTFFIDGISRALLQELECHNMASSSVKSTQYRLKELKEEYSFSSMDTLRASKYLVMTQNKLVDEMSIKALENLRIVLQSNLSNEIAKYCLPESYKTSLTWTINARSLQNVIALRSSKSALWEIKDLASQLFKNLPQDHKYLFENCVLEQE